MSDAPSNFYDGLGASIAGAICDLDRFKSRYALWCEYTDPASRPNLDDNEAVEAGLALEPAIAQWAAKKRNLEIDYQPGRLIKHPTIPYLQCHPDAMVLADNGKRLLAPECAGLEVKNRGFQTLKLYRDLENFTDDSDRAQPTEVLQCHASMLVTGATHWYLAVAVAGQKLLTFRIERDEKIAEQLYRAYADFWQCVQTGVPPPPTNLRDAARMWPHQIPGLSIEATPDILAAHEKRKELKRLVKDTEDDIDFLELRLKVFMAEAEELRHGKVKLLTWKQQERKGYTVEATKFRVMR